MIESNRDQRLLDLDVSYNNYTSFIIFPLTLLEYILEFLALTIDRSRIVPLNDASQKSNNANYLLDIANKA